MQGGPYRTTVPSALQLEQTHKSGEYGKSRQRGTFCCWRDDEPPIWMTRPIRRDGTVQWLTPAVLLWGLNAFAFVFHTALTFTVLGLSVGLENWKTHGGVLLPFYKTRLEFTRNNASDDSAVRIDFVPTYERQEGGINLTGLTILFFALSAFFHFLVIATAWKWSLYYWWIDECRNPLRYASTSLNVNICTFALQHTPPATPRNPTHLCEQVDRVFAQCLGIRLTLPCPPCPPSSLPPLAPSPSSLSPHRSWR